MTRIVLLLYCCLTGFAQVVFGQSPPKEIFYAGTFSDRGSKGIYVLAFDRKTGNLTELQTLTDGESPTFMAIHPNGRFLYVVYRKGKDAQGPNGEVTAYQIDRATGGLTRLNEQSSQGAGPCHVSIDPKGRFAYVSNYGSGNLAVYRLGKDGKLAAASEVVQHAGKGADPSRQDGPHMHSIIPAPDGKFIYATDLGIDKIMIYQVDGSTGKLKPASQPYGQTTPGAGPRHLALHPNGKFAYSAQELNNKVASFRVDNTTGALTPLEQVSMLPADFTGKSYAADIHFSPDGKFLYASNRGHDSIVIYAVNARTGKLTLVGHEPTRGKHPRNFRMDARGAYLFVANRDDDNIVVFGRDAATGKLTYAGQEAKVPAPAYIQQVFLK